MTITNTRYVLAVHDIKQSAQYYTEQLGFKVAAEYPGWVFLAREQAIVMMGECKDAIAPSELGDHSYFAYIDTSDIDSLYNEFSSKQVSICKPLTQEPWGMKEFAIETLDGHRIMFGEDSD